MMSRTVTALDTQQVLRDRFSPAAFMTEERESLVHYHSICFGSLFICAISVVVVAASFGVAMETVLQSQQHIWCTVSLRSVSRSVLDSDWLMHLTYISIDHKHMHPPAENPLAYSKSKTIFWIHKLRLQIHLCHPIVLYISVVINTNDYLSDNQYKWFSDWLRLIHRYLPPSCGQTETVKHVWLLNPSTIIYVQILAFYFCMQLIFPFHLCSTPAF